MIAWLLGRKKAIAGLIAVVLAWGPLAQQNGFHALDLWTLAAGLAGVLGIHAATNDKPLEPWNPATKMVDGDAGQTWLGGLVLLLLGFVLGILWKTTGAHF